MNNINKMLIIIFIIIRYAPRDNLTNDRQRIKDKLSGIVQDKQG